jgi:hypothetical protein
MANLQDDLRLIHEPAVAAGRGPTFWVCLAAIVVAAWALWLRRRGPRVRRPSATAASAIPPSDPLVELELAFLRARSPADYPAALTAMSLILRRAWGQQTGLDLTVLTTSELLTARGHEQAIAEWVAQFLAPADEVRFAGAPLDAGGFLALYEEARSYLLELPARATGGRGP